MSMSINDQITFLKEQLATYQAESPVDTNKVNTTINKISELEYTLQQQQAEQEEREQRKQETIETTTSIDILAQIFDTLLPADKFEVVLGPNRYDVLSQDFKQVIQMYVTETVLTPVYAQHDLEISQKDERIRLLNDQSLSVQNQLDDANREIQGLKEDAVAATENYHELMDELKQASRKVMDERDEAIRTAREADATISDLRASIAELQTKLEAAQMKPEAQPSKKLDDMLSAIKSRKELSPDDHIAKFMARTGMKIELPEVKAPEITGSPFRGEEQASTVSDATNDQVLAARNENVKGEQFPVVAPALPLGVGGSSTVRESGEEKSETVTRAEFEELKSRVAQLEVGKGAVA